MIIIYVSGLDGCGKTTQARVLVDRLQARGFAVEYRWLRWEPSLAPLIKGFRRLVFGGRRANHGAPGDRINVENLDHSRWRQVKRTMLSLAVFRRMWLWYAARDYRRAYVRARRTWRSDIVVLDRYLFDFLIDQSLNLDTTVEQLQSELRSSLAPVTVPDLGIVIDVSPQLGYERKRDGTSVAYLARREPLYRSFNAAGHVLHVDGSQGVQAVSDQIFSWVEERCQRQP